MVKKTENKHVREVIYNKYGGCCAYCGDNIDFNKPYGWHIDHINPIDNKTGRSSNDILNNIENLNPCCVFCNASKGTLTIEDWRYSISQKHIALESESSLFRVLIRFPFLPIRSYFILKG